VKRQVAVLGSGPAGLLAAHAATIWGFEAHIISATTEPSKLYGAQYLHEAIPEIPHSAPVEISVELRGTVNDYREKVYGADYKGPVSPAVLQGGHFGWDIRQAYNWLWDTYGNEIYDFRFNPVSFADFAKTQAVYYDYIFSSIPLVQVCGDVTHEFFSQHVYAIGDAQELGIECPVRTEPNMIRHDGTKDTSWYRASNIFGHGTAEWPAQRKKPPIAGLAVVTKPLSTNCTCGPNIIRIGRYGQWKKGVLAHTAFEQVDRIMRGTGVQDALF